MKISNSKTSPNFFYFIFFLSGFSGLIYESIWSHYLKLYLGHAAYAQTLVLVIYMGGMALGAWGIAKYSLNIKKLFFGYAIAEGIIGILGILFHHIFVGATDFSFDRVIPILGSSTSIELFKWTFAALLILPQSVLLGTTFPLMTAGIVRKYPKTQGKSIASLYFLNSLGASIGILFSGFYLIEKVGLPGTVLFAGIINLLIALAVGSKTYKYSSSPISPDSGKDIGGKKSTNKKIFIIMLFVSGLTGMVSFMYEIGWIRMLNLVLGSSTHAFELMLSSFILGLAIGSWWIKNKIGKLQSVIQTLGFVQLIMGTMALLTIPLYDGTFNLMAFAFSALGNTPEAYSLFNLFSHSIALLIMLPATIFAGMTLPLITYYLIKEGNGEKSIGYVYGINTIGAIIGVILAVHIVMPMLGLKNVIVIAGFIDIVVGLFIIKYFIKSFEKLSFAVLSVLFLGFVFVVFQFAPFDSTKMASGIFRYGRVDRKMEMLFHKDGKTSTINVYKSPYVDNSEKLVITTNGKPDASMSLGNKMSSDEITQTLIAAIPLALTEKVDSVAAIGMGSGKTSHVFLHDQQIKHLDVIEIEPAMVEGAAFFGEAVENVFNDPRCQIHIEDAKTFFTRHQKKYNIIISEPSNVWVSGVSSLFSGEFYTIVKKHLHPDGLLVQWMHLYESDMEMVASVIKAMSPYFNDYVVYFFDDGNIAIIAKPEGLIQEISRDIFSIPAMKAELNRVGLNNIQDIQIRRLAGKKILDPLFQSYSISANSDYSPVLDLRAVKSRFLGSSAVNLQNIILVSAPLINVLENKNEVKEWIAPGENNEFIKGIRAKQALEIYNFYKCISEGETYKRDKLTADNLEIIKNVNSLFFPGSKIELEEVWLNNFNLLMQATIPFLTQDQMMVILNFIKASDIYNNITDTEKSKIDLYTAIVKNQYDTIINKVNSMLPESEIQPSSENDHLVMLGMMSYIALKQNNNARLLWNRYTNKENPPLKLRLLVAHAYLDYNF